CISPADSQKLPPLGNPCKTHSAKLCGLLTSERTCPLGVFAIVAISAPVPASTAAPGELAQRTCVEVNGTPTCGDSNELLLRRCYPTTRSTERVVPSVRRLDGIAAI